MKRSSANVRYYFLLGAYGISIGCLLIAVFVGAKILNFASWGWGQAYLVWIISFGLAGITFFSGALLVGAHWRQVDLVERPDMQDEQYKLLVISVGNGIILITSLLTGVLTFGFSAGTFGVCLLVPLTILLWLFSAFRFAFRFKDASLPLLVNSMFIGLVVLLNWTNRSTEFGFRWRLSGYEEIVRMVERGELQPDDGGFVTLPADYQWLSDGGEIIIIHREEFTSIIFFTQLEFPGEDYAIAYRSDDSLPENEKKDRCDRGWRVQADIPQWFVCISTRLKQTSTLLRLTPRKPTWLHRLEGIAIYGKLVMGNKSSGSAQPRA